MKKICKECNTDKNIEKFSFRKDSDSYRNVCKKCRSAQTRKIKEKRVNKIIQSGGHNYSQIFKKRKECMKCHKLKLGKFFYKVLERTDGLSCYCKTCDARYARDRKYDYRDNYRTEEELDTIIKTCSSCNIEKLLKFFIKESRSKDGISNICKDCSNKKNKLYKNTKKGRLATYKIGAKKRNIEWSLSDKEFYKYWQSNCTYCDDKIKTIGLDRIDSTIGYQLDNIVPCCFTCNSMKKTASLNDFKKHIEKIYRKLNDT